MSLSPEHERLLSRARWIWPENQHWDLHNCYALFRHPFVLKKIPSPAPLLVTADQSYQLYLNGRYVCRGPARGFQRSWPYDEVDVRQFLCEGSNLLAIRAHNPGRSNFLYVHQSFAGLLVAAEWAEIYTNESWKCRRQTGVHRNTVPSSLQLFDQEWIDLRVEDPAWKEIDFDDSEWNPKVYSSPWNALPWTALEERGMPMLDEEITVPERVIGRAGGRNTAEYLTTRNLAINRANEGLAHDPDQLQSAEEIGFSPVRRDRWTSHLIDFGRVVVGSVLLEIEGAVGGEIVETFHSETINAKSLQPDFIPDTHCRMAFANRVVCREGCNEHAFFHPLGFRYVVLTVRGNASRLMVRLRLRTALYPMKEMGAYSHSDPSLVAIWKACAWTQRICTMDAYVDTPWREQAQWWGDARVQAWNTFYISGDTRVFQRGIRQIGSQTTPDGLTYGHAPTMAHNCVLPDFTLIWMATLWDYYWQTGSLLPFLENLPSINRALEYFQQWTDPETGLLRYDDRYWLFLDWADLRKDGCPTLYSLWLLYTLEHLAVMAEAAERPNEAGSWKRWASRCRKAIGALLSPHGLLRDGILPNGTVNPDCSIHVQTMAILTNLAPEHEGTMMNSVLLPFLRGEKTRHTEPSAYWITYVYSLLIERGYGAEVIAHLRERWKPMAEFGTTSERFQEEPGSSSRSHAWSAHPIFHLMQVSSGIRQTSISWNTVDYRPVFDGEQAKVTIPTPHGLILSEWSRTNKGIDATLALPRGIRASVILPDRKPISVTGHHRFQITERV